jgi:signal transduction histidine kinase
MRFRKIRAGVFLIGTFFALLLFHLQIQVARSDETDTRNVLFVSSGLAEFPVFKRYFQGIRDICDQLPFAKVEIFQESTDMIRIKDEHILDVLPDYFRTKYARVHLDAIIASEVDDKLMSRIFPGVPLISDNPQDYQDDMACQISASVDLILHLQPRVRKILFVSGTQPDELYLENLVRESEKNYPGLEFEHTGAYSYEELLLAVSDLPEGNAILYSTFATDAKGKNFIPIQVCRKLSQISRCPIYGMFTMMLMNGIIGGPMHDAYLDGLDTGRQLRKILCPAGNSDSAAFQGSDLVKQVDAREMARWGLSESNLPQGYEVINRSPSIWREHRWTAMLVLLFILVESCLVFSLLVQRKSKNRALKDLSESGATLQVILSSIPVGVLIIEAETGIIRQANRTAGELLGHPVGDIVGQTCRGSCRLCTTAGEPEKLLPGSPESFENCIQDANGKKKYLLQTINRITLDGELHFVECLLDITEIREAQLAALQREAQLVHADKMISLGTMAAGIGHEINNPNNFILISTNVIEKAWEAAVEKLDEYVAKDEDFRIGSMRYSRARKHIPVLLRAIVDGAERIKTIVNDMQEFVRQDSGSRLKIDINDVVLSSVNLLSNELKKRTRNLSIEYGSNLPSIEGNAKRLGQVVINLLLNAAHSLPDREKAIKLFTRHDVEKNKVILQVIDEGTGIEPRNMKRIFDPFFTTKRETGGTGLGLAISLNIIEAHNGTIDIVSKPGEGTTVTLEFSALKRDN